jgi:hypothetical protein
VAAFLISAVMSWLVAIGAETLGGLAPVYVHDRGGIKDTDFAVFLIGAHALLWNTDYPDFVSLPGDSFPVLVGWLPIFEQAYVGHTVI